MGRCGGVLVVVRRSTREEHTGKRRPGHTAQTALSTTNNTKRRSEVRGRSSSTVSLKKSNLLSKDLSLRTGTRENVSSQNNPKRRRRRPDLMMPWQNTRTHTRHTRERAGGSNEKKKE